MHCLPMSHKVIKQANCLHTHYTRIMRMKYWKNEIKHTCNETIQPPETNGTIIYWGPTLLGAEFVRGRLCQGPSLSGAEMSRNQAVTCWTLHSGNLLHNLRQVFAFLNCKVSSRVFLSLVVQGNLATRLTCPVPPSSSSLCSSSLGWPGIFELCEMYMCRPRKSVQI